MYLENKEVVNKLSRAERRRLEKIELKLRNISGYTPQEREVGKGEKMGGVCGMTTCKTRHRKAEVYNHGSRMWYCIYCGLKLNEFNPEFEKAYDYEMCQYKGDKHKDLHDKPLKEVHREIRKREAKEIRDQYKNKQGSAFKR